MYRNPKNGGFIAGKMFFIFFSILSINNVIAANAQIQTSHNGFNFVAAGDYGCDKKAL